MARLVVFDETVRAVDLPAHPVILGRSRKADIPIHDNLLSRKHCTIIPHNLPSSTPSGAPSGSPSGSGYRLIDLKSSNGTFLNGLRVERTELNFDDIIEIGHTVIVLLDTDTWQRGEGLTRLRNPIKAQELIQAIKKRLHVSPSGAPSLGVHLQKPARVSAPRPERKLTSAENNFLEWARKEWLQKPVARQLLEGYLAHHVVSLVVKYSPELRDLLSGVPERIAAGGAFEADLERFQEEVRKAIDDLLAKVRAPRDTGSSSSVEGKP